MKFKIKKLSINFNDILLKLAIKMQNLTFKKLFKITLFITTILVITHVLGGVAHAASVDAGINKIDAFDKLTGDHQKWISSTYRNNYSLDIVHLGVTDIVEKATNGVANILFSLMCMISYICVATFYFCFNTNISDLFKDIINNMQESLRTGIFDNVFLVAFIFIAIYLIQQLLKRNTVEIFTQIFKLLFIIVLSFLLTTETSAVITNSTEIAKSIGAKAVVAINNTESTQSYAADVSGNLWYSLVHEPWLMMEANNKLTENDQEAILKEVPSSDARQKYVQNMNEKDPTIFAKDAGTARIAQVFIILILTILKAGIMLLIALVQIAFQVMAILCVLLSMVALLLAMVPQLGGMTIIENLAKRIFETQLGIVITTFMLALMTEMDQLIMINFNNATNCGWLICLILQTAIYVAIYVYRKKIFKLISVANQSVKSGHVVPQNFVHNRSRQFAEKTSDAVINAPRAAGRTTARAIKGIRNHVNEKFSSGSNNSGGSGKTGPNLNDNIKNNTNSNSSSEKKSNDSKPNLRDNIKSNGNKGNDNLRNNSKREDKNANTNNGSNNLRQNMAANNMNNAKSRESSDIKGTSSNLNLRGNLSNNINQKNSPDNISSSNQKNSNNGANTKINTKKPLRLDSNINVRNRNRDDNFRKVRENVKLR